MKNITTKIILSVIIFLSAVSFIGTVSAAGASLYVSPASITKTAGNVFNVSVGFNASGNKVCAVEGTLVFNNLSCQSITVAGDVMAQSSPTCSNPHFLIGIPNCTTLDKALLTVSVKAGSAGTASVGATSVDVIGEGASVGSDSISGNYAISAVLTPVLTPKPTPKTTQQVAQATPTLTLTPTPTVTPNQQVIQNNIPANVGTASFLSVARPYFWPVLIIIIILCLGYGIYYFATKRKTKV